MIRRLEQVAALVVAAGLAIVSYWLFFSWAQGGGARRPAESPRSALPQHRVTLVAAQPAPPGWIPEPSELPRGLRGHRGP
ncbi:hypothetical protein IQ216_10285 [Cyanobium sp. LEGE 06143]|uniref:hypothetical protein n=1 Tax=unclassified Cyanobium TaxID=2627006 RepID=UPI001647440F|nr:MULTISPECIES: hypothetical protein [unclassified Cyanobium]MBE9173450.1 hypothetical protein [Cyanobium sp. LEGE 06143]QNI69625.1 hypothetical protein CyaNS01_00471 [Cyanobium sp. NS01]